jgi:predicted nucleotide-binding protein
MQKEKVFEESFFAAEAIEGAIDLFLAELSDELRKTARFTWTVQVNDASWTYESRAEFIADYRRGGSGAFVLIESGPFQLLFQIVGTNTRILVGAPTRAAIERVFAPFDATAEAARLPASTPDPPRIFIGHGRNAAWRDLKDHLHEQHGYAVEAYEIGARAGHAIRDILDDMLTKSSFALLVLTAEDETADGQLRARQNVVHELGLFQGRLGFARALVLVEEGTEMFSNLQGIHQIRFRAGAIKETYGDVLATLRREFGASTPS